MRNSITVLALLCFYANTSFAFDSGKPFTTADHVLEERILLLDAQVDMRFTNLVRKKIIEYTSYKRGAEKLIQKSKIYFPIFEKELAKYGIPQEFKYLPLVESNLKADIKSRAGAVGLWQFMKATGQSFGLKIGAEVDERMDAEKATKAAAQYLLELHKEFNDWTLVLAAYNSGAGNIRKAIRKSGSKYYWDLNGYLPRETRSYLPKFVAAAYLMNYHQDHGIDATYPDHNLVSTISAKIFDEIDFATISESSGTSIEIIEALNPQYFKGFIPQNNGVHILELPAKNMSTFLTNNYSAQILVSTLPEHFKRSSVSINKLDKEVISTNKLIARKDKRSISLGVQQSSDSSYTLHKLGKKETLLHVAQKAGLSFRDLLKLNNLTNTTLEKLPKYIKVPTAE